MTMVFCRGCGKEIHETATTCPHCGAPQGNFPATSVSTDIPDGVKGWSWGAFLLNWIWAIGNKTWIGLLALVPYLGFIMAIVLGIKGREWAWKNKQWESVEHFNRVQRKWSAWGLGIVGGCFVLGILAAIAIPAYVDYTQRAKAAETQRVEREAQLQREAAEAEARAQAEQLRQQQAAEEARLAEERAKAEQQALQNTPAQAAPAAQVMPPAVAATPADFAPSFDCAKVTTGSERLICSNRDLAAADVRLLQSYREAMARTTDKEALKRSQVEWLRMRRDACFDVACLQTAYRDRITELSR